MIGFLKTCFSSGHISSACTIALVIAIAGGAHPARAATIATANSPINAIAWSPDGSLIAIVSDSNTVTISPVRQSTARKVYLRPARILGRSQTRIKDIAWMPDGGTLLCLTDEGAEVWDADRAEFIRHVPAREDSARLDGPAVKTAVFDFAKPYVHPVLLPGPQSVDEEMSISPSGRWLAISHWDTNETIHDEYGDVRSYSTSGYVNIYDITTGKLHKRTNSVGARVLNAVWSADGGTIASRCGDMLTRIWDVRTGKVRRALRPGGYNMALSPDGALLASADTTRTHLWNIRSGKLIRSIVTGDNIETTFTPANFGTRSSYLLTITRNGVVLYNPRNGRRVARLSLRSVADVSFAPRPASPWAGSIAVAAGQTVRAWKP